MRLGDRSRKLGFRDSNLGRVAVIMTTLLLSTTATISPASASSLDNVPTVGGPNGSVVSLPGDATFSGTLPTWAGQGSTLDVYQWPDLSGAVIGQPNSLNLVASMTVTGTQFNVALPNASDSNYQFVLQSGSTVGTTTATTGGGNNEGTVGVGGIQSRVVADSPASMIHVPAFYVASGIVPKTLRSPRTTINMGVCWATLISNVGPENVVVGEAHTLSTTSGTFAYGGSTTSTVGIGISSSGAAGSFSSEGNYSQTTGWTTTLHIPSSTHEKIAAQFTDGKFNFYCGALGYFMGIVEIPYHFLDNLVFAGPAATNPSGTCPVPPGAPLTTSVGQIADFGSSVTYGSQVSLLGFGFSESTSWTIDSSMTWVANPGTGETGVCGPGQTWPNGQPIVYNSAL